MQTPKTNLNPAQLAAKEAWAQLQSCLDQRQSFIFEAGAGAGKTYSLIEALRYLIKRDGTELLRNHQQIACITYTKVATNEIETRTDKHPAIYSSTIHSFCWALIQRYQPFLRAEISSIEGWPERLKDSAKRIQERAEKERTEAAGPYHQQDLKYQDIIGNRCVEYSQGHPRVDESTISLGHNDVLIMTSRLFAHEKFRQILVSRFPVIFIDEFQDTDNAIFDALNQHIIGTDTSPIIGFFGDHWQKIYGSGCGAITHPRLKPIGKRANFRSVPTIVECLNRMRPELPQAVKDPTDSGSVIVFHTNGWKGVRQTGPHWGGDVPALVAHLYLEVVKKRLLSFGWDLEANACKVLMLTHNVLATEQGYQQLAAALPRTEHYIKKEDPHIAFLIDTVEPVCRAFANKRYGEMHEILGRDTHIRRSPADKAKWAEHITSLLKLRETHTIGDVIDHLRTAPIIPIPETIERKERALVTQGTAPLHQEPDEFTSLRELRSVPYKQIIALKEFIDEKTPFSTQHGVKGAEFENVLVVLGRGWNLYNFGWFLECAGEATIPANKTKAYERNRNLFYVACSRPKRRLALLFTQELSNEALATLKKWFGNAAINSLPSI